MIIEYLFPLPFTYQKLYHFSGRLLNNKIRGLPVSILFLCYIGMNLPFQLFNYHHFMCDLLGMLIAIF